MPITVHFATNRRVNGPADRVSSYTGDIVAPSDLSAVTYATAFVGDGNLSADTLGAITAITDVRQGSFSPDAIGDLSNSRRNLLVFIHGFDNSFENSITRAAFNTQWFAASGVP